MIHKIKELLETKEAIKNLQEQVIGLQTSLRNHELTISDLSQGIHSFLKDARNAQIESSNLLQEFSSHVQECSLLRQSMNKELQEIKLLKSSLHVSISDHLTRNIDAVIEPHVNRLKTDVKSYNELKQHLQGLSQRITDIGIEVKKLQQLSSNLNQSDGQMLLMAKELMKEDRHKLELMRKIEQLERLVSKERRNKR